MGSTVNQILGRAGAVRELIANVGARETARLSVTMLIGELASPALGLVTLAYVALSLYSLACR